MPTNVHMPRVKNMENVKIINLGGQVPINFMDGLALLFIGLKLTDHLQTWTWIETLSPLWAPFMLTWFIKLIMYTFYNQNENGE